MKRNTYRVLTLLSICGLLLAGSQAASAKPRRGGGGQAAQNGPNAVSPPTTSPSNAQANAALADMKAAETAVDETFESSREWLSAQAAIKQAQADYNDSCGPALDNLKADPAYKDAVDVQAKADAELTNQQNTGSPTDISEAAQAAMQARSTVKAMESKALDTDPTTVAAKQKLTAAFATLSALRQKEQDAVHADPTWMAAKKRLDAARAG